MKIILEDSDFEEFIDINDTGTPSFITEISAEDESDDDLEQRIFEAIPQVFAQRFKKIRNNLDDFDLQAFDLTADVGGKPFGVGVSGKLTLKYAKK